MILGAAVPVQSPGWAHFSGAILVGRTEMATRLGANIMAHRGRPVRVKHRTLSCLDLDWTIDAVIGRHASTGELAKYCQYRGMS